MTGRRQRELAESFRLFAGDEQWFLRDVLVGVVGFVVWVAGTGALAAHVASAFGIPLGLAGGETPSVVAIALFAVLWLVVPAVAVIVRLRHRALNLRGNVEQYYRFDHPSALLAPPALLVVVVGAIAVVLGAFPWYFTLVMIPVSLAFLVRTLAFSYRVYSFSHPLIVQALVALSTVALIASAFAAVGTAMGRPSLVDQVLRTTGLPAWITGTVSVEGVTVSGVASAALLPVVLATTYVLVQAVVALGVRLLKPDVDRSRMRTGQRYPPFLPAATPVQTSVGPANADDAPDVGGDGSTADAATASTDDAAGTEDVGGDEPDDPAEDDLDDVSNTRVFTPPADDGDAGFDAGSPTGAGSTTDAGSVTDTGSTADVPDATRAVPGTDADEGASARDEREYCEACGESFSVDTAVRFCPNCGVALEGE